MVLLELKVMTLSHPSKPGATGEIHGIMAVESRLFHLLNSRRPSATRGKMNIQLLT